MKADIVVVSLGDPFSTNIELASKVVESYQTISDEPVLFVGSLDVWNHQLQELDMACDVDLFSGDISALRKGRYFLDISNGEVSEPDAVSRWPAERRGDIARRSLEAACRVIRKCMSHGNVPALITGPIDKKAVSLAGFSHPGHTEYLSEEFSSPTVMVLSGPRLNVGLVSNHVPLADVCNQITQEKIYQKGQLYIKHLKRRAPEKKISFAVAGLNPHCGDDGLFGSEETEIIAPAVKHLREEFPDVNIQGPLPADTIFYRAFHGEFDGVLAMYHDQALGPLKTVHFDTAVNISVGLPFLRVSPDHGPASDLFLQDKASPMSWQNAFCYAWNNELRSTEA